MYIEGSANPVVHQENGSTAPFIGFGSPGSAYSHDGRVLAELSRNLDGTYVFTHTQGLMVYLFDAQGKLTQIKDRNNYATTLTYSSGQLQTVSDSAGRNLTFTYACGLLIGVGDPAGRTISFSYDGSGNLSSATDVAGNMTHYTTYDANHHLLMRTDPNGGATSNTYDSLDRVTFITDPMTRTMQYAYSVQFPNNTTIITDPRSNVTRHTYLSNRLVSVVQNPSTPQEATWQYMFGGGYVSGLASMTDPNNHTWSNTWDARGNLTRSTDPLSRSTSYAYTLSNDLSEIVTPDDIAGIAYTYDARGNQLSMTRLLTQTNDVALTTYAYDPLHSGDMLTMTNPLNKTWNNTYDTYGYGASSTNPLTQTATFNTDILGRTLNTISPRGSTSTSAYNAYGDAAVMTDSLGYTTTKTYDGNSNLISTRDANNHVTTYTYDLNNERTRETRPDGTHSDTAYDAAGNVISETNGLGQTTLYSYDSFNRLVTTTDALSRTTTYAF